MTISNKTEIYVTSDIKITKKNKVLDLKTQVNLFFTRLLIQ